MAVSCENQLLLLTQPADGPVPEPSVLGAIPPAESLIDDDPVRQQVHPPPSFLFPKKSFLP